MILFFLHITMKLSFCCFFHICDVKIVLMKTKAVVWLEFRRVIIKERRMQDRLNLASTFQIGNKNVIHLSYHLVPSDCYKVRLPSKS